MLRYLAALALVALASLPAGASEAIRPIVSAAAESNHVFCDATGSVARKAPCFNRGGYVTTGAVAGYIMTFNAIALPANGAVTSGGTGASSLIDCVIAPANSTISLDFGDTSDPYTVGLTAAFSTTGCFTLTASATAFFKGRVQ